MDRAARIVAGEGKDMNQEDIIRMAREAGFYANHADMVFVNGCYINDQMERFAAIVAAAEREACAQVCNYIANKPSNVVLGVAMDCAAAIRARGNT
jgi:hypothetical protein